MKILKRLSIFLIMLIVLFTSLMIPQDLARAEESEEVVEYMVIEERTETAEDLTFELVSSVEIEKRTETAEDLTFELVSSVEIEKSTGENPPIDVKEEINNFAAKVSAWINENTGIVLSGTMSLIVLGVVIIVVVRFLGGKRRR